MFIPDHLAGTPAGELLARIEAAARERGLFVKRERRAARYGADHVYTVFRGDQVDASITIEGTEGKTLRAKSSQQLQELLEHILTSPELEPEEIPTQPISGNYLLTDEHREQLRALGVIWSRERGMWLAPAARLAEAMALLEPRAAIEMGRLSQDQESLLKQLVPEGDRRLGSGYRWTVLRRDQARFLAALQEQERVVGLGTAFPRSANEDLRGLGARWDGLQWTIRADREARAREIIARHLESEQEARRAEAARREQQLAVERAAGILRWSQGEGYGGEYIPAGELLYMAPERGADPAWYLVTECTRRYVREDGMSFGVGDEQGYIYSYAARPATAEESAEKERERQAAISRRDGTAEFDRLWQEVFSTGAPTEDVVRPDGEILYHPTDNNTLYGGGRWLVVGPERIWAVRNNGADGDNWSANNVQTGGAGAIGRWVPATPELVGSIQAADARAHGRPRLTRAEAVERIVAATGLDPELFPAAEAEQIAKPDAVWSEVGDRFLGLSPDRQRIYSCCGLGAAHGYDSRGHMHQEFMRLGMWSSDNVSRYYVSWPATPERLALIEPDLPEWVGTADRGRFFVDGTFRYVTDNAADALLAAAIWSVPVQRVLVTPDVELVHVDQEVLIWSDGALSPLTGSGLGLKLFSRGRDRRAAEARDAERLAQGETPINRDYLEPKPGWPEHPAAPDEEPRLLSPAASRVVRLALGTSVNRVNPWSGRFHELYLVSEILSETEIAEWQSPRSSSSGTWWKLKRLELRFADGPNRTLFVGEAGWWSMGEDGDADSWRSLFENEAAARAWLKTQEG